MSTQEIQIREPAPKIASTDVAQSSPSILVSQSLFGHSGTESLITTLRQNSPDA
jgi:hypothetical protein